MHYALAPETVALIVTIGNAVIGWIALEASQGEPAKPTGETASSA
jgi:hypothetical protein